MDWELNALLLVAWSALCLFIGFIFGAITERDRRPRKGPFH